MHNAARCTQLTSSTVPLLVLVAGPYRSGTGDEPAALAANVEAMNRVALEVLPRRPHPGHRRGDGVAAGGARRQRRPGDGPFDEIFHPFARRLLAHCDAVLRTGGPSAGADEMVALARASRQARRRLHERVAAAAAAA